MSSTDRLTERLREIFRRRPVLLPPVPVQVPVRVGRDVPDRKPTKAPFSRAQRRRRHLIARAARQYNRRHA